MSPFGSSGRRSARACVVLVAAAIAGNAVSAIAVARGLHLRRLATDPARIAERPLRAIEPSLPAQVQLVSCQKTEVERHRSLFLATYFLAPRVVQLDHTLGPVDAVRAALERGGAIVVEAIPGTACARDLEAELARGVGPPRTTFSVRTELR